METLPPVLDRKVGAVVIIGVVLFVPRVVCATVCAVIVVGAAVILPWFRDPRR